MLLLLLFLLNLYNLFLLKVFLKYIFEVFFLLFVFKYGLFLKSVLNLLQYCFCFMFWFFGREACEILALWPGVEPTALALEGEVLTTGLPGRSLLLLLCHANSTALAALSVAIGPSQLESS